MGILELLTNCKLYLNQCIEVEGLLVVINKKLFILANDLNGKDYQKTVGILVSDPEIIYVLNKEIIFTYSGSSFVFHQVKAKGVIQFNESFGIQIQILEMVIQEHNPVSSDLKNKKIWITIPIDRLAIANAKLAYPKLLEENDSLDWLDN